MNELSPFLQNNFYAINAVVAVFFIVTFWLLLIHLLEHMRQMVRMKYHIDNRAEFDESRVKIIIFSLFILLLAYFAGWIYSLTSLDLSRQTDLDQAVAIFKATSLSLLVSAYAMYFMNNRIKSDIAHIKRTISADQNQQL